LGQGDYPTSLFLFITVLPHPLDTPEEAVKKIYGFCSDYPGIRHSGNPGGQLRELEVKDSIIVPLMLLTASGYFLTWQDISKITGIYTD
jgi:hypothetical protein